MPSSEAVVYRPEVVVLAKRVLVVEDDPVTRIWLTDILRNAGYEVAVLGDGQAALDYLRTNAADLILLDMLLPVLDGWHFLDSLAKFQPRPSAAIIITTANAFIGREWVQAHGCAGFLHKPVNGEDLLAEIRRCLA
jgi:CheY-like chemotaxis protein